MSKSPKPVDKNLYLLSRVRFLEDRLGIAEANLGRMGDYLGFIGEQLQQALATLEELKPKAPAEQEVSGEVIEPPAEQPTFALVP